MDNLDTLEHIFMHLGRADIASLARCRRVCKSWCALLDESYKVWKGILPYYETKKGAVLVMNRHSTAYLDKLRETLTVKPWVREDYGQEAEPFPVFRQNKRKIYVPKFYIRKQFRLPPAIEKRYARCYPAAAEMDAEVQFTGKIRPNQEEPIAKCQEAFATTGGGILNLSCGFGKTTIALYLAAKLGLKTLVIVHKGFLLNQWIERIHQFLPEARIGVVQQKQVKVEDKDIVIAMLQSISMRQYNSAIFDEFGLTIVDECHRIPCKVFSRALFKINTPYMLGLSATPTRQDGMTKVLKWFIGPIVYSNRMVNNDTVVIDYIYINSKDPTYNKHIIMYNKKPNRQKMLSNIIAYRPRNEAIVAKIAELRADDRKILLLSDRRAHLEELRKMVEEGDICSVGFYMGGIKQADLDHTAATKDLVLGTFSMAAEAMDIPKLDTLILATPKSATAAFVQSIGRIDRKVHEVPPVIVDVVDSFSIFQGNYFSRRKYYQKMGYVIDGQGDAGAGTESGSESPVDMSIPQFIPSDDEKGDDASVHWELRSQLGDS